eukprot:6173215-Pleurochrysis_carterae.AAC.2
MKAQLSSQEAKDWVENERVGKRISKGDPGIEKSFIGQLVWGAAQEAWQAVARTLLVSTYHRKRTLPLLAALMLPCFPRAL